MRVARWAALCAALVSAAVATGAEAQQCQFGQIAEMKLIAEPGPLRVAVEVNGRKGEMELSTSSHRSGFTEDGANALGIRIGPLSDLSWFNQEGQEMRYKTATLSDVVIGGAMRTARFEFLVSARNYRDSDIVGWLGQDFLAASDVEYELSKGVVRFFKPRDCASSDLAYWGGESSVVDTDALTPSQAFPAFEILLNGKPAKAGLITSAGVSVIDFYTAQSAGIVPGGAGVETIPSDSAPPFDEGGWVARFPSVQMGHETIKNVRLTFRDLWSRARAPVTGSRLGGKLEGFPDMMLGSDFLASHRVLIANSQKKIYFSYTGGPPFAAPPRAPAAASN